jgi:uncharacterized membrane protein
MYHSPRRFGVPLALSLALLSGGILAAVVMRKPRHVHRNEDAPERALREQETDAHRIVGRTVTIARPRDEVYARWRDFPRFPDFMENVSLVEPLDERRSRWRVEGPGGTPIEFISAITQDEPGKLIAWASEEDAAVANSGRVTFRDAPGGRGTEVDLEIAYNPPGGSVGAMVAKMFQREPNIQARRDLKRFKQLMETGEIATSRMRPAVEQLKS